jgi:hypothetical protein
MVSEKSDFEMIKSIYKVRVSACLLLTLSVVLILCVTGCDTEPEFSEDTSISVINKERASFLSGTWSQDSMTEYNERCRTVVEFDDDGHGRVWSYLTDATGLTETFSFAYSIEASKIVALTYAKGGSESFEIFDISKNMIGIIPADDSEWFHKGYLLRDE